MHRRLDQFLTILAAESALGRTRTADAYAELFPDLPRSEIEAELAAAAEDDAVGAASESPSHDSEVHALLSRLVRLDGERFDVGEEVAAGGMGAIHTLRDAVLERKLALKRLRDGEGSGSACASRALSRFVDEAQITAQLDHPGVVPIHDVGIDAQGRVFFTMKFVEGRTLTDAIRCHHAGDPEWTSTRLLRVFVRVCETVAFAHSRGVIHRDLKPDNVMVGGFGAVYVMDWGLAKTLDDARPVDDPAPAPVTTARAADAASPLTPGETVAGTVMGTPSYMAPEQALGQVDEVDARSDVYALGAVLYEALSGRPPYTAGSGETSGPGVIAAIAEGDPDPLERLAPDAPDELRAISAKAMSRGKDDRYPDVNALRADLENFLEGRVVGAYRTGPLVELAKWVRRNRVAAIGSAATLLAVLVGAVAILVVQDRANEDVSAALTAAQDASESESRARRRAEGERLSAVAMERVTQDPALALLLAVEGAEAAPGRAANTALWAAMSDSYEIATLIGHDAYVMDVEFSPDERLLLSVAWENAALLWDTTNWTVARRLVGHSGALRSGAFDRAGKRVLTASADGTARLFDVQTGQILAVFDDGLGPLRGAALSPDESHVLVWSEDGCVGVFDVASGALSRRLPRHEGGALGAAWYPDGVRIASIGRDRELRIWRGDDEQPIVSALRGVPFPWDEVVSRVLVSPGGSRIVTLSARMLMFDGTTGEPVTEFGGPLRDVDARGELLLAPQSIGGRASIDVVRFDTGEVVSSDPFVPIRALRLLDRGGRYVGIGEMQNRVLVRDVQRDEEILRAVGHQYSVRDVAMTADGRVLVSAAQDGTARVWDLERARRETRLRPAVREHRARGLFSFPQAGVAWVKGGNTQSGDGASVLLDLRDGRVLQSERGGVDIAGDVAYRAGEAVLAVLDGAVVSLRGVRDWQEHARVEVREFTADLSLSPGARYLAAMDWGRKRVGMFDVETAEPVFTLGPLEHRVAALRCLDDDGALVTTSTEGFRGLVLWDGPGGAEVGRLRGHTGVVVSLDSTRDGSLIASVATDGTARVWDRARLRQICVCRGTPRAQGVAVSLREDGAYLIVTGNRELHLYDARTGSRLAVARPRTSFAFRTTVFLEGGDAFEVLESDGLRRRFPVDPLSVARGRVARTFSAAELDEHRIGEPDERLARIAARAQELVSSADCVAWGDRCLARDDLTTAERAYGRALELRPGASLAHLGMAAVHAARSELEPALDALERALNAAAGGTLDPRGDDRLAALRALSRYDDLLRAYESK